ncbi:MAG: hypothetical protein MUF34_32685, partial [Polyangiaceae bacterium]|nr:hypothetical protein [Polyangiaceae bacterium]
MRFIRKIRSHAGLATGAVLTTSLVTMAAVLDPFGPPPAGDPSAFTGPLIGEQQAIDDLALLPPALEGAFDGGPTGTPEDAHENIVSRPPGTGLNVPTEAPPSPLFGALPFTQQLLLFEEFG